jgi:primosomal protein N''
LGPVRDVHESLRSLTPIDTAIISEKALEGLPNTDALSRAMAIFDRLSAELLAISEQLAAAIKKAEADLNSIKNVWDERRKIVEATYERLLRELQKSKIDGEEFIRLRRQIEGLRPLKEKRDALNRDLGTHEAHRRKLLSEWEDVNAADYRAIQKGRDSLIQHFGFAQGSADRIASANPELFMRIEELELAPTTKIELNTAPDGEPPSWHALEELSTGQKATAVLLLLLLESEAPLIVDQPEDDLDNRFITDGVVPIMRQEKRRRQFVFSTHNANIPVLGDAELIIGLTASGEAKDGVARIPSDHMASIDVRLVREMVEEILEGGKAAFEMRR